MININNQSLENIKLKRIRKIALFIAYFAPILTFNGGVFSYIGSILLICSILLLFLYDEFYLIFPILIFFYSQLVIPGGIVVYRAYSLLFLIKFFISDNKIKIYKSQIIPLFIFTLYCLLIVSAYSFGMAISIILDMVIIVLYIWKYLKVKGNIKKFLRFYVFAALGSSIYGFFRMKYNIETAVLLNGSWVAITRFLATFDDPNYVGFFFNIAIFSILSIEVFKNKLIKWSLIVVFYLSLLATTSMTGIICNVLGIALYLLYSHKINIKYMLISVFVVSCLIFCYKISLQKNIPVISNVAIRISSEFNQLEDKNYSAVTSNRTDIWKKHIEYWYNQPTYKIIFGGNYITDYGYDIKLFKSVSHQTLIDMLLNFGILGSLLLIINYSTHIIRILKDYKNYKDKETLAILMAKYVWLFYAFGLSMFPSWRFNLFFIL